MEATQEPTLTPQQVLGTLINTFDFNVVQAIYLLGGITRYVEDGQPISPAAWAMMIQQAKDYCPVVRY